MSEGKIRYKAIIAGKSYTIIGSRTEEHMRLVANTVDEQLRQIESLTKGLDPERRAVLAAVNAVSDQLEMQIKMDTMQKRIAELERQLQEAENQDQA